MSFAKMGHPELWRGYTKGRGAALRVVMVRVVAGRRLPLEASTTIAPEVLLDCTMSCARPLKRLRRGLLSGSWQLGSPLPTLRKVPAPETLKEIMSSAGGR